MTDSGGLVGFDDSVGKKILQDAQRCKLCGLDRADSHCTEQKDLDKNSLWVNCKSINKDIEIELGVLAKYEKNWHILAGIVANNISHGSRVSLSDSDNLMASVPSFGDQLNSILLYDVEHTNDPFVEHLLTRSPPYLVYCKDANSVLNRVRALEGEGLLRLHSYTNYGLGIMGVLTIKGANVVAELQRTVKRSDSAFIAMEFGPNDYAETIKSGVKKGCAAHNIIARTVNEHDYGGDIMDKILAEIKQSAYVIVDYTLRNPGVYYESGYARGRKMEVIETCNKKWYDDEVEAGRKPLHFDVAHRNMIMWNTEEDLAESIKNRIEILK